MMSLCYEWQEVVKLNPTGEVEIRQREHIIRGQLKKLVIDDFDIVVIELEWAASMPTLGNPGFGVWTESTDLCFKFPNLAMPFQVQDMGGGKGRRILFGLSIIYLERIEGVNTLDRSIVQKP